MQTSSWVAAGANGAREYVPVSAVPLEPSYVRIKSEASKLIYDKLSAQAVAAPDKVAPASAFVAAQTTTAGDSTHGHVFTADRDSICFGYAKPSLDVSSGVYGATQQSAKESIDLLTTVPMKRDNTFDSDHRASMEEKHFLSVHDSFVASDRVRAASFKSGLMLRESMHRHVRSPYHPEDKYILPPTAQSEVGWGISAKYVDACSKYQEGAQWHGRKGSHITHFSERLLLGARHHLSGPMTNPKLHY